MKPEDRKYFEALTGEQLMALCIYGEARGEKYEGRVAVGSVMMNRERKGGWFGKSLHDVILKPFQFSCFLENDPNFPRLLRYAKDFRAAYLDDMTLRGCTDIAAGLLDGTIKKNVSATHYKTINCKASWADKMKKVTTIGNHEFYS